MNVLERISRFGLALFALASVWQTAPGHIGIALALLAGIPALWNKRRGPWDASAILSVTLAVWLLAREALQTRGIGDPDLIKQSAVFIDWLFPLAFAPLAALPAADRVQRVRRLWLFSILGCTLGVIGFLYTNGPQVLWSGERLGFHLNRPLGIGLYAGCFIVVIAGTWRQWWHPGSRKQLTRSVGLGLFALYLQVLVTTQNRTTYLALVVVLVVATLAWLLRHVRTPGSMPWRRIGIASVVVIGVGALLIGINHAVIEQRLTAERTTVLAIESDGLATAPASSISARLQMWRYVLERFPDAPWIGHGFGSVEKVLERDLYPRVAMPEVRGFDHVHNSYLETLWMQGLVGFALWAALSFALVRDVLRASRRNEAVRKLLPTVWAVLGFVAVWACFDYRLNHPDMRFFSILLLLSLRLLGQAESDVAPGTAPAQSRSDLL